MNSEKGGLFRRGNNKSDVEKKKKKNEDIYKKKRWWLYFMKNSKYRIGSDFEEYSNQKKERKINDTTFKTKPKWAVYAENEFHDGYIAIDCDNYYFYPALCCLRCNCQKALGIQFGVKICP